MYQPWIFATVTTAGAGLVALTVSLQRPPQSLAPPPAGPAEAVHIVPPAISVAVSEPTESPVLELSPVVIRASMHRALTSAPEPAPKLAERPCSAWRELGPTHVIAGKPSGDLSVRELCD